jgi:hypothetical protein
LFALAAFVVFLLALIGADFGGASPLYLGLAFLALHLIVPFNPLNR